MSKQYFDFEHIAGKDRYKLLSGLIVPRPIGWIGTRRANGTFNLAPFSFFNVVSTAPPTVLFSGSAHSDRPKDSITLAEESGEFTVNIVSEEVAEAMSVTA
ncbi:MAG: flavin reductase family protein, partial [Acidimicrobiia bacterium]